MAQRTNGSSKTPKARVPTEATSAAGLSHPYLDAGPQFQYIFHPSRWCVMAGKLVPSLSTMPLTDGSNGVAFDGEGRLRFAGVRARLETEGRRLVPYAWAPDGESYMQCIETRPDGQPGIAEVWISVFETASPGARNTEPDEEGYAEWLTSLVSSSKLPPCPLNVARDLHSKAAKKLKVAQQLSAKSNGLGSAQTRVEDLLKEVEVLANYIKSVKAPKVAPKTVASRKPTEAEEE